jgi:hypothetical protein
LPRLSAPHCCHRFLRILGLRNLELEATYAIEHGRTWHAIKSGNIFDFAQGVVRFIALELPNAYGTQPGRSLVFVFSLWTLMSIVYYFPLRYPPQELVPSSAIYRIWSVDRIAITWDEIQGEEVEIKGKPKPERLYGNTWFAIRYAAYFSLLSAFHIGWREINVGTWISRIQPREYTLRGTNWIRFCSGIQALFSVFLLATWLASYLGKSIQ